MIFPLINMEQVVPAVLHILLGDIFLLYNLLLDKCQQIDKDTGGPKIIEEREKLNSQWEGLSLSLLEHEKNMRDHCFNIITMINHLHRYEATAKGDKKENIRLSVVGDT